MCADLAHGNRASFAVSHDLAHGKDVDSGEGGGQRGEGGLASTGRARPAWAPWPAAWAAAVVRERGLATTAALAHAGVALTFAVCPATRHTAKRDICRVPEHVAHGKKIYLYTLLNTLNPIVLN